MKWLISIAAILIIAAFGLLVALNFISAGQERTHVIQPGETYGECGVVRYENGQPVAEQSRDQECWSPYSVVPADVKPRPER